MSWPAPSQFSIMLQQPQIAFRDVQLQQCKIERNEMNLPRPWAGAFAVVYKAIYPNRALQAVRVFSTESPERRERYFRTYEYLKGRKMKCLVNFQYVDDSIRCTDGRWYPMILMDWVEGDTLFKWVNKKCSERNGAALSAAADCWLSLTRELTEAQVAHGDLQHNNIIVTPEGRLKLVDYDCMSVPGLFGRRNLEIGVQPYQHPKRGQNTLLSPELDRYSTIVIYLGLKALSLDPSLWDRAVLQTGNDKILFRVEDFQNPQQSATVQTLLKFPNDTVRMLTSELFYRYATGPLEAVPSLWDLVNPYKEIEALLKAGDYSKAVEALNQRGRFLDAPDYLKPAIQKAYEEVCVKKAREGWTTIPRVVNETIDRRVTQTGDAIMTKAQPGVPPLPPADMKWYFDAKKRVQLLDRLAQSVNNSSSRETMCYSGERTIVQIAAQLPKEYVYSLRPRVEAAKVRVLNLDHLISVIRKSPDDEVAIHKAYKMVKKVQCETIIPPEFRPRVELAESRYKYVKKILAIQENLPLNELDAAILEAWNGRVLSGCKQVEQWEQRYNDAVARRNLFQKLQDAIGRDAREEVVTLINDPLMKNYPLPKQWTMYVNKSKDLVEKAQPLEDALKNNDPAPFVQVFDARIFRDYSDRYEPYFKKVLRWANDHLVDLETVGLKAAMGRAGIILSDKSKGEYRLRWTWPHPRFSDVCVLGVTKRQLSEADRPDDADIAFIEKIEITREQWDAAGGSWLFTQSLEASEAFVSVWAEIDLGFTKIYTQPFTLGQLEKRSKGWIW